MGPGGATVSGPGPPGCCFASCFNSPLPCALPPTSEALPRFCCGHRRLVPDHGPIVVVCSWPQRPGGPAALASPWRSPPTAPSSGPHVTSAPPTPWLFSCLRDLTKEDRVSGPQPGPGTLRGPASPLGSQTPGSAPEEKAPANHTAQGVGQWIFPDRRGSQGWPGRDETEQARGPFPQSAAPSRLYHPFLPNKGPARPGSSRCCSIEISSWFPINHSLWCLGGLKESNKTSFLSRKSFAEA